MFRRALIAAGVVVFNLLASATTALAAGDPTKIGKSLEDIVTPNVKSFWKIGLLVGVVVIIFGRVKSSVVVAFFACILLSGIVIFNPGGMTHMVQTLGNKIL
jgi:hypothetical protein